MDGGLGNSLRYFKKIIAEYVISAMTGKHDPICQILMKIWIYVAILIKLWDISPFVQGPILLI